MGWIFDNINVIIVAAGAIAYWLNARARQKAGKDADYDGDGIPDVHSQPREQTTPMAQESEAEERARRIREEIRRKIQERMSGGPTPSPYEAPRPVATPFEIPRPAEPEVRPPVLPAKPKPTPPARNDEEIAARQRHLAERMAELAEEREVAQARAATLARKQTQASAFAQTAAASAAKDHIKALSDDLHDPANLRRAIIWQEILGKPVSQR